MFCYTSGTTGDPKAAMLSHGNMISVSCAASYMDVALTDQDSTISYLPLAHSFE
jgi:long-chain acyl-CoA synthetase